MHGGPAERQSEGVAILLHWPRHPGQRQPLKALIGCALAAVTDFAFSLGLTRLKGSTLRRRLLAGDMAGAAGELLKWIRAVGRVLPGLVLRREAEVALLCSRSVATTQSPGS